MKKVVIIVILVVLVIVTVIQAVQLSGLKIGGIGKSVKTAGAPLTGQNVNVPSNTQNLPNMVGGC